MGLHSGPSSDLCDRNCREGLFREHVARMLEAARAKEARVPAVTPEALRAVTADSADSVVETGVARNGLAGRALRALSRLLPGNRTER